MTVGWFNLKVYAFDVIGFDYVFAFKPEIYGAFSRLQTLCLITNTIAVQWLSLRLLGKYSQVPCYLFSLSCSLSSV